jgi:hypothetical protein
VITIFGVGLLCIAVEEIALWRDRRRRKLEVASELEGDADIMAVGNGRYTREIADRRRPLRAIPPKLETFSISDDDVLNIIKANKASKE